MLVKDNVASQIQIHFYRCFVFGICLLMISPNWALPAQADSPPRRVNIPHFSGSIPWAETAIFWFGQNEQDIPGKNYADVRMAYTDYALEVRVTVVDYYLWYDTTATQDLTQYDALALYLDTNQDGASTPQTDDYFFLYGARHWQPAADYQHQAQGNGTGWDETWSGDWTGWGGMSWSDGGPNNNGGNIDYGWTAGFVIPWDTLGLSGPPPEGTLWGFGVQLYDRDAQPPAGYVAPEFWPETFDPNSPASWGEIHFGYADYPSSSIETTGSTMIRAATPVDNTVEDAWMGGGGLCASGHEGGTEINHGNDTALFTGSEVAETHFPCFNKSYLRFALDAIPSDKVIISATLTLHHWGNADPSQAQPSWVHLFTITDPWDEMTIHWNNAPLAQENVSATWINPVTSFPGWPGIPYHWDATQAVAEAYADNRPASLAIYSSDSEQHSSKYLTSSEIGIDDPPAYWNWDEEGRPTLRVFWGDPSFTLSVNPAMKHIAAGEESIHTIQIQYNDSFTHPITLTTSPPAGLNANLAPTQIISPGGTATLTLTDTHSSSFTTGLWYTVPITVTGGGITRTTEVNLLLNGQEVYLPLVMK